jgi:hypothetical protein
MSNQNMIKELVAQLINKNHFAPFSLVQNLSGLGDLAHLIEKYGIFLENSVALQDVFAVICFDLLAEVQLGFIEEVVIVWVGGERETEQGDVLWDDRQIKQEFAHDIDREV